MEEVFNNIRYIKANCYEMYFMNEIEKIRERELVKLMSFLRYRVLAYTVS